MIDENNILHRQADTHRHIHAYIYTSHDTYTDTHAYAYTHLPHTHTYTHTHMTHTHLNQIFVLTSIMCTFPGIKPLHCTQEERQK